MSNDEAAAMELMTMAEAQQVVAQAMPGCVRELGISVESLEPNRAVLRMPFSEKACREGRIFSGQALAALADTAMCFAVWCDGRGRRPVATTDLHVTYLRAGTGEDVVAQAEVVRAGGSLAFARVSLLSPSGDEVATAVATFALPRSGVKPDMAL
ncbi:PaaI family thioesterase [Burkholderia pseudomallei]|uniref:PaaI family thioesterase n=1 Tax=Burkholderia pseudomallei TaxID=28450 RepID=UPI001AD669FB|nr:PaaI family thioesterase [Burkholderia pseudomallei]MBO7934031.1 PaaI family thioesterase [Burkholderia pseudomallei]